VIEKIWRTHDEGIVERSKDVSYTKDILSGGDDGAELDLLNNLLLFSLGFGL
jgi:hypothetical protein